MAAFSNVPIVVMWTFFQNRMLQHIHRIHKWRTRGKKLVPSHESEALEDKQKFQIKTFRVCSFR